MSNPIIAEGTLIDVSLTIRMPCAATAEQLEEWLDMEVGNCGGMENDNPLLEHEPESWGSDGIDWDDTGMRGRTEESPHIKQPDGSTRYTTRCIREPSR